MWQNRSKTSKNQPQKTKNCPKIATIYAVRLAFWWLCLSLFRCEKERLSTFFVVEIVVVVVFGKFV